MLSEENFRNLCFGLINKNGGISINCREKKKLFKNPFFKMVWTEHYKEMVRCFEENNLFEPDLENTDLMYMYVLSLIILGKIKDSDKNLHDSVLRLFGPKS